MKNPVKSSLNFAQCAEIRVYRALVEVITPDYRYWNPLAPVRGTREQAESDVSEYLAHKKNGTGGFRAGCAGRTRIDERDVVPLGQVGVLTC